MVWNGVLADLSRLAGAGRGKRFDLRVFLLWHLGGDSFHGPHNFWRWSPCGLCGGNFEPTALDFAVTDQLAGRDDKPLGF